MKNRKLAKHIDNASWYRLIEKLAYKAKAQSKHLVKIDPWFASSKICAGCGHKVVDMSLNVRTWDCPSCGNLSIDRDIDAASIFASEVP